MSFKSKGAISALCVLFFAAMALAQTRDTLVITGTVKDSAGAAVANAIVTVGGGGMGGARDTTDASGAYSITYSPGFTPTTVTVTATAGTQTGRVTVTVPTGSTGRIPLTGNITIGSAITPAGRDTLVISGTVKDSSGAAVANVIVTVGGGMGAAGARDTTDASGAYSITYIPVTAPASVTVTATLGTRTGRATVTVPTGSTGRIPLTANITLPNAVVVVLDTFVISGTVKDSAGAAVANAIVTVGGGFGGGGARDTTDASGAYSITYTPATAPATITVTATEGTRTGRATVTVPTGSTGRIPLTANITLPNPVVVVRDTFVITGTVKDSAGAAVANAIVTVGGGIGGAGARDTTDASGAYSITYMPATAPTTITVTATEGTRTGRTTVTVPTGASGRIPLTANITIGVVVTPSADTVVITGTVKDSTGAAIAGAVVTVGGGFGGGARDTTDASGAFSITMVNTARATSLTVTARITTGAGAGTVGTAIVTIANPSDGVTDHATATITLGRFAGVVHGLAPKAMLTRAHMPSYGYSIDGRRIVTSPAGVRANGIRVFKVEGSQKVLTIK